MRRGLAATRTQAQEAIAQGLVTVDGAPAFKPATQVRVEQALHVAAAPRRYVSRGGEKLAHALEVFSVDPSGRHALDAGVSTGGFTDCLLQRGAARVLAYDVGYGQVHESLRTDPRVVLAERTNVRDLVPADIPPPRPDLLVADLSFISLAKVLPGLLALLRPPDDPQVPAGQPGEGRRSGGQLRDGQPARQQRRDLRAPPEPLAILLVKPQFEAERGDVGDGGIVRDPQVWRRALERVAVAASEVGWLPVGATASPLLGGKGNVEFLLHLRPTPAHATVADHLDAAVQEGLDRRRRA